MMDAQKPGGEWDVRPTEMCEEKVLYELAVSVSVAALVVN